MRLSFLHLGHLFGAALLLAACSLAGAQPAAAPVHLRVVGGLAGVSQYVEHEEPFWTRGIREASGGRITAEIAPFDRIGIRAQEALRLAQLGVVPFGHVLLSVAGGDDPVLAAPDLAGLNADFPALRRTVAAYRETLAQRLRDNHGVVLLAVYAYPAQVVWCDRPFASLADLAGRRVRASGPSQADFLLGIGAVPVTLAFQETVPQMRSGGIACAITGAASGRAIGLPGQASHLGQQQINHGLSAFVANASAWAALPQDVRATLTGALAGLERAIWQSAERETAETPACLAGRSPCTDGGAPGRLALVPETADDARRRRAVFREQVLPRWLARCGPECQPLWDRVLAPVAGRP